MDHTDVRRRLSAYLDDAVDPAERGKIDAHLAGCGSCRKALGELERTVGLIRSLPEVEPPPWLARKIMARVRDEAPPQPAFWRRLLLPLHVKLPLEALALVFVCVTGYYIARMNASQVPLSAPEPALQEESLPPSPPAQHPAPPKAKAPAEALSPAPHAAAPVALTPALRHEEASRSYAPPPPAHAPSFPPVPASPGAEAPLPVTEPHSPRDDGFAEAERNAQWAARRAREPEAASRRDSYTASGGMMPRGGMQDAASPSTGSSRAWSGSTAFREYSWAGQPPRGEREELTGDADQGGEPARVEVTLRTGDPAGAVGPIEEAVRRSGGNVVRRAYEDSGHRLIVQVGAQEFSSLLARLERIGKLRKSPRATAPEEGTVILDIRW